MVPGVLYSLIDLMHREMLYVNYYQDEKQDNVQANTEATFYDSFCRVASLDRNYSGRHGPQPSRPIGLIRYWNTVFSPVLISTVAVIPGVISNIFPALSVMLL